MSTPLLDRASRAEVEQDKRSVVDEHLDLEATGVLETGTDVRELSPGPADLATKDDRGQGADNVADVDIRKVPPDVDLDGFGGPDIDTFDADEYVDAHRSDQPRLAAFDGASDGSRRVLVSAAMGEGHAVERHSNYVDAAMAKDRVERLHDPANTDETSRLAANDAYEVDSNGEPVRHRCGVEATFVNDGDAMATALVRATENPAVRAALDRAVIPGVARPEAVEIPIVDLLGPDGHQYCEGARLIPSSGQTLDQTKIERNQWVKDQRAGVSTTVPAPVSAPIPSFEGGTFLIAFKVKSDRSGYTISTMFPQTKD